MNTEDPTEPAAITCSQCSHSNRPTSRFCGMCGIEIDVSFSSPLVPGTLFGSPRRYRIDQILGRGGFAETYRALDINLMRFCVVKRLSINPNISKVDRDSLLSAFEREAKILAQLNTPGNIFIPEIYEYLPQSHCLVMKYIEGKSLAQILNQRADGLLEDEALHYIRDICSALVYMHTRPVEPVLHGDIKPGNILLGANGRIWLIDFGLSSHTFFGAGHFLGNELIAGTPGYAPPEQWRGAAEPRSDVYALASTLYTLLTNDTLWKMDRGAMLTGKIPSIDHVSIRPEVKQLITHAMAPNVHDRPTAQEFLLKLDKIIDPQPIPQPISNIINPGNVINTGNTWSLLVGVNHYEDPNITDLSVCSNDVESIHSVFENKHTYSQVLSDDVGNTPIRARILAHIGSITKNADKEDMILFYFSGHGVYEKGESYLLPRDAYLANIKHTSIAIADVIELMKDSSARAKVIIIDACHSGASLGKSTNIMTPDFIQRVFSEAEGIAVLSSCKQGQQSFEWPYHKQSVFTHYLLEALKGNADIDHKGFVTVNDVSRYVTDRVKIWSIKMYVSQVPTLQYTVVGDIVLCQYNSSLP